MLKSLAAITSYRQGDLSIVKQEPWLQIITSAEEVIVNIERIDSMKELFIGNPVLDYVEKTLRILDDLMLSFWVKEILEEVLIWSEVAKGGTVKERIAWQKEGVNLFVHNIGSAELFNKYGNAGVSDRMNVIHSLIATHGLIGQYLRGEVIFAENRPLSELVTQGMLSPQELTDVLIPLNECVIGAVSPELWLSIQSEIEHSIQQIVFGDISNTLAVKDRIRRLRTATIQRGESFEIEFKKLEQRIQVDIELASLKHHTLWFVEAALQDFTLEEFIKVFMLVLHSENIQNIRHISFEPLMNTMYYDYKGVKKMNIYKKRIIEKYLQEFSWQHIRSGATIHNQHLNQTTLHKRDLPDTLFFTFEFSAAAEKLIEFCIEAEKSPLYEKAVLLLFDLFDLRRDAYDRFNNEEEYLSDMNQTADYKKVMLQHIVGQHVLDIGPGGGVMLDLIEQELPNVKPIGIDISSNVIEALERKKQLEGHTWEVMKGDALALQNYVEKGTIDTVIFSSILHELYSYIPYNGHKFNHDTVAAALTSAYAMLSPGGRIIIRDGIMTEPINQKRRIIFYESDGVDWLRRYAKDFAGREIKFKVLSGNEVIMLVNDAMEFLYTYTWGAEAYVHEVQEQFGYFTPSQFHAFIIETLGEEARILVSQHILQAGYTEELSKRIKIMDEQGNEVDLPDSTCLLVIAKPE
ncbi:MAG TPA: class I SAM-dependent methyltransferase [Paenibacillus sp.]|jgi:cyclopropane fatty-acyl-phospholipid synthase-like methyltransferase